jgi:rhamnose utilization protein RhaD (predicted bifunctional aldolase and dehydrogenase)/NADP-dependent 3-hydroxy acid dehydrogenase YdfG
MENRWSDEAAAECVARYASNYSEALALRTYGSRLLGAEPDLVLHGGGNTSVKDVRRNLFGEDIEVLFVKASGADLADIEPEGHVGLQLQPLRRLSELQDLSDAAMVNQLRAQVLDQRAPNPSIEALVHAFVPGRFVDHTHADAVLALSNQSDGETHVRRALGDDVVVMPYLEPGFRLAQGVVETCAANPHARVLVWMRHGIMVWADTARECYRLTVEMVSRAQEYLDRKARRPLRVASRADVDAATRRLSAVAPLVRGALATPTGDADRPLRRPVLLPLVTPEVLGILDSADGRRLALSPPLTSDHLIRTRALPAWVEAPAYDDEDRLRTQLAATVEAYAEDYRRYLDRHAQRMPQGLEHFEAVPRIVLLPGLGALCAGENAHEAGIVRDITLHTLLAKERIAAMGSEYRGLDEAELFAMEYRGLQHAKIRSGASAALAGQVALVSGAAGAIGAAICERLLEHGAHVAVTDLPGPALDSAVASLRARDAQRVTGVALDVTDAESVAHGFDALSAAWGGVDLLVINAGLAHVSALESMDIEQFRRLERVNTEGTLLLLREAARRFQRQRTGGDVVLVSTKNVFAPGAQFGAYSATKAAAQQLARIASLELAAHDVRVSCVLSSKFVS